jgi:tetratricopeptide (TPR) repeat protein
MAIEMGMRLVREALAEAPSDAYLCEALAGFLSGLRIRLENAADLLGAEAVRLRPDDPWLLVSLGATYATRGDLARAEAAWTAAVERLCGSDEGRDQYMAAHALVYLGKILRQQGKEKPARAAFRRAAEQIAFLQAHGCAVEGAEQALRAADPDWGEVGEASTPR